MGMPSQEFPCGSFLRGPKLLAGLESNGGPCEAAAARRLLLRQRADSRFQAQRGTADTAAYALSYDQALQLVRNKKLFDLTQESAADDERYGTHEMGQQCLLARRLLEQGVTCVKVLHGGYDN